jgi:tetratricopeptide (TPR) repeat protein
VLGNTAFQACLHDFQVPQTSLFYMKKLLMTLGVASLLTFVASRHSPDLVTHKKQVKAGIVSPLTLCGTPGARVILKLMDTTKQMAPLLENLGKYGMRVTTSNDLAQKFFNQGINLYYGFNHFEAYRSFMEVARLDPDCAMSYWGQALSLGPNINLPMDPADTETVYKALQKALSLSDKVSPKERALIHALAKRYTAEALEDRSPLDEAYAEAMGSVAGQFGNDLDVATLYAESLMDLHPWDFWKNGQPQPWTPKIVELIGSVIAKRPEHPGANHLNIHILEASPSPDKAVASADRLRNLVPGAGHMVHMPSHIYIRVGRYLDGVEANERAVKTDEEYIAQCNVQGIYPLFYYPHNYHFLLACTQMAGLSEKSMNSANALKKNIPEELLNVPNLVTLQHWYSMAWYNMVRFGKWNEILKVAEPVDSIKYVKSVWHYARGMAFVRTNKLDDAKSELVSLKELSADPFMEMTIAGFNSFRSVLTIGSNVLEAEIEAHQKNYDKAVGLLIQAIEIEDNLLYQEPPDWYHPVRQILGSILLEAMKPADAEQRFREDLRLYRNNGWSLFGLYQSLEAQGKKNEATQIKREFDKAFAKADVKLKSPRF